MTLAQVCDEMKLTNIEEDETCHSCPDPSREGLMTCGKQECVKKFILETIQPDLEEFR